MYITNLLEIFLISTTAMFINVVFIMNLYDRKFYSVDIIC